MDFKKIVFATDFSENSNQAFEYALNLARKYDALLVVVHVISEPIDLNGFYVPHISFEKLEEEVREGARRMMDRFCETCLKDYDRYEASIERGLPFAGIIQKAEDVDADLIVLGTHGRTGLDHVLFGSTAEKVVRKSPIPVLTVRAPEEKKTKS
jgi:nucleotide-binding universal stress UspA family protein